MNKLQRLATMAVVLAFFIGGSWVADAASYERTDGYTVDPIHTTSGGCYCAIGWELGPDSYLRGLDIMRAVLTDANLSGSDLSESSMPLAVLYRSNLKNADLSDAFLSNTQITFSDLRDANLTGAYLYRASLRGSDLTGADLSYANLTRAYLIDADFSGADLTGAFNLESTSGPAFYDADTDFTDTFFDPVAAGWIFVPEPSGQALGMAGLFALLVMRGRDGGFSQ